VGPVGVGHRCLCPRDVVARVVFDDEGDACSCLSERGHHPFGIGERRAVVAAAVEDKHGGPRECFDALRLRSEGAPLALDREGARVQKQPWSESHRLTWGRGARTASPYCNPVMRPRRSLPRELRAQSAHATDDATEAHAEAPERLPWG